MSLNVKAIIINVQAKNGMFSIVFRGYRIKNWPEMCCTTTAKLQFLSLWGYQTNSLINRDDTEQAMIYQKLLVKPLFYGYLNCCLAVLKHISISLAIYLYLHIFPNFFFFIFFFFFFFFFFQRSLF